MTAAGGELLDAERVILAGVLEGRDPPPSVWLSREYRLAVEWLAAGGDPPACAATRAVVLWADVWEPAPSSTAYAAACLYVERHARRERARTALRGLAGVMRLAGLDDAGEHDVECALTDVIEALCG